MNVGLLGEVQVVVKRADGSVKLDTGFFPNVITNLGLDAIGNNIDIMGYCAIGTGNVEPKETDTGLVAYTADGAYFIESHTDTYDPNVTDYYKCSRTKGFRFSGLSNVNISEVGLVSTPDKSTHSTYTRTLIKNSAGSPTTITVLDGEILELQYRLWQVFDIRDKKAVVNAMIDGVSVPYNVTVRAAGVGGTNLGNSWSHKYAVGNGIEYQGNNNHHYSTQKLGAITGGPASPTLPITDVKWKPYSPSTYKRSFTISNSITEANMAIRSILLFTGLGAYQIEFGTVDGDLPITKTNEDIFSVEFELSWGRYQGVI